ncbi:SMI1/KNR4 family protein [Streptomyces sp. NPDC048272]|uniref:SMI1/KNR4 family protein n=1 Tax=Streptomyces sp. NPDC048272 TaxID=3154616 RepID=UPI0034285ED8
MSALEQLQQILTSSDVVHKVDWDEISSSYDVRFPTDYRNFLDRYGSGEIEDMLAVFRPTAGTDADPHARRTSRLPTDLLDLPEVDEWSDARQGELYEPADVMVWGETVEADVLGWITSSETPDEWPVAVYTHGGEWTVFDCTMTEFLLRLLTGQFEENPTGIILFGMGNARFTVG